MFLCDAVMPLITHRCMNLIHKKDKGINNKCFVVIPVIDTMCTCFCVCVCVYDGLLA